MIIQQEQINKIVDILLKNSISDKDGKNTRMLGMTYFEVAKEITGLYDSLISEYEKALDDYTDGYKSVLTELYNIPKNK